MDTARAQIIFGPDSENVRPFLHKLTEESLVYENASANAPMDLAFSRLDVKHCTRSHYESVLVRNPWRQVG